MMRERGQQSDSTLGRYTLALVETSLVSVLPLSGAALLYHLLYRSLPLWATLYAVAELAFFLHFLYRRRRLLSDEPPLLAPSDRERDRLMARVLETLREGEDMRRFLLDWMHAKTRRRWSGEGPVPRWEDLRRDNVKDLLAAAFFGLHMEDVETHLQHKAALDRYLTMIEDKLDYRFPEGRNGEVETFRQMLEEVDIRHRPLIFYTLLYTAHFAVCGILKLAGFERHKLVAPLQSAAMAGRRPREGQAFEYHVHPGLSSSSSLLAYLRGRLINSRDMAGAQPIVILCGLGGVTSLVHAVLTLLLATGRPIFLVGLPAVSMRLKSTGPRPRTRSDVFMPDDIDTANWEPVGTRHHGARASVPGLDLQARGLRLMLGRHGGHASAIFVSHSLGTGLAAFTARFDPKLVSANILIDPICFLTCHAHLVKTFLYKRPQSFGERFIGLFRHEIGIAHTLSRSFLWFQAAAFLRLPESTLAYQGDTLDTGKTHVVISSNDAIIPVEEVIDYLERGACPHTALEGATHAGFLMHPSPFLRVMKLISSIADTIDPPSLPPSTPSLSPVMLTSPPSPKLIRRTSLTPLRAPRSRAGSLIASTPTTTMLNEARVLRPRGRRRGSSLLGGNAALVMTAHG